jgi:cytoskeleton protein RodZ
VGFIRTYSDYLGLDAVQSVERYKREIAGRGEIPVSGSISADMDERRLPHGWVVIAIVVLGLVVYGAYHLAITADTLLKPTVAPVPERMAAKIPPPVHTPKAPPPSSAAPIAQAPQPSAAQQAMTAPDDAQTAPVPGDDSATLPAGQVYGAQNKDARVVLHANQTTRILVQAGDGTVYINRTLHAGDSYRVPDRVGLTLTTPNGGAIALELDGQLMGAAGKSAQMTEALSLDPQAIVDRSNGNSG